MPWCGGRRRLDGASLAFMLLGLVAAFCGGRAAWAVAAAGHPSPTPTATPSPSPLPAIPTATRPPTRTPAPGGVGAALTGDCNGDNEVAVDDIIVAVSIALETRSLTDCPSLDVNGDQTVTVEEIIAAVNIALNGPPGPDLTRLIQTSPAAGESGVALTRETVLRFNGPLAPASVTLAAIHADSAGTEILSRLHLSPDRMTATLFYSIPLPASARVRVTVDGNLLRAANGRAVDADGDGQPGGVGLIDFDTLALGVVPGTAVCGRVFASELIPGGNGTSVNEPLAGVLIEVDGNPDLRAVTDQFGDFRLDPAPAGRFFVFIVGRNATNQVPPGAFYPNVGKAWEAVAGQETNVGEIYLPLITPGTLQPVSQTQDTEVKFPAAVINDFPELADVRLMVPADSLFANDGTRGGMVGIAPVAPDRIPSRLPAGLEFPLVITVQTDGAQNFDKPVPVCFPNLPDPKTGRPLPAGAESALWSFDHDTGQFEVVGPMRVTADGKLVCTEPGVGIIAPGWHGSAPGASGSGGPLGGPAGGDGPEKGGDSPPPGGPEKEQCKADNDDPNVDPVYLFSGEFYEEVEDLRIKGRGLDFIWSRKYRSKIGPNTVQGNGWDFSYNISLDVDGADVVVCDGNSRRDRFFPQPVAVQAQGSGAASVVLLTGRTWTRPETFSELTLNPDGTWTYTFPDGGTWVFNPVDGSAAQGKIRTITDVDGNRLAFAYDGNGRLATVTDTLDRTITVAYNADGFIESVTDFAGRQVRYTYYRDGESGGSFGDLKSVRSPTVTGTPNGNDFPNGKLTTYTYSTGFADDRLNHNLLTITDGRRNDPNDPTFGQGPYLRNVYAATQNPDDASFDHVVRQFWGGPNDIVDIVYVPQTPSAANASAYVKTIVRDRVGNVIEYFFEPGNRVVIRREYTGRADPSQPTTETANRPKNKLRASDPAFFETRYEWNDDSQLKRVIYPNGNSVEYVYESDLDPNAPAHLRGNLRTIRRVAGPLASLSDQSQIEEHFEYDDRFGCGRCAGKFVTRHVDGRGNETLHVYDERGNRTQTTHRLKAIVENWEYNAFGQLTAHTLPANGSGNRRRDEFHYYTTGPQRGYLQEEIIDARGLALASTNEYDAVGNLVRRVDARGHDTRLTVNALGQTVRETSREVTDGSAVRYERDTLYDANNNIVRTDVQNVDERGQVQQNTHFSTTIEHDLLNRVTRRAEEVEPNRLVTTDYAYDANRNITLTRFGEATTGHQPANARRALYDERNLLFREIKAEGAAEASTTQYTYDGNRNLQTIEQGLQATSHVVTAAYDGFDRPITLTDAMGNVLTAHYDANGNLASGRLDGELQDVVGSASNVRLVQIDNTFDAMDRHTLQQRRFFDPRTQAPVGDGQQRTQAVYSGTSQVVRFIDDNGHETQATYDTANRAQTVADPKGNMRTYGYDQNGNITRIELVDKSDLGSADEHYVFTRAFDNLDRLIRSVDSAGGVETFAYDSRGNQVLATDGKGNTTRSAYDGLNRLIETTYQLTDDGSGSGTPIGNVRTQRVWDDSSRLLRLIDDNGHETRFTYDALNRRTRVEHADGTAQTATYDAHGNAVAMTDANGSRVDATFDANNRLTQRSIARAAGVLGPTLESFAYDGRGLLVAAQDDDAVVTREYDSLGHVTRQTLNGENVASTYDAEGNALTCTYPGGRQITTEYDELNRKRTVRDQDGVVATYSYVGRQRIARRDYGNGTRATVDYDSVRRVTHTLHDAPPGGVVVDDRTYTWDAADNKTGRRDARTGSMQALAYDSLNRLVESITTPPGGAAGTLEYVLDGAGNRTNVDGGGDAGSYVLSATSPTPADFQVNQYSATPFDARQYDANGNLVGIDLPPLGGTPDVQLAYDYRNRLVQLTDATTGVSAHYAYDPLGRRIASVVDGGTPHTTRFFYDGWQEIEEQDAAGSTQATYVYGNFVDEVLSMRRGANDFFFHSDDRFSVTAVTDAAGGVVERYRYDDYGRPHVLDANGAPRAQSTIGNPWMFTGRRLDLESGLYFFRMRYLDPRAGRFITRDPIGAGLDPLTLGNAYAYVGNNPFTYNDPLGLFAGGLGGAAAADALISGATAGAGATAGTGAATGAATTGGAAIPGLVGGATGSGVGATAGTIAGASAGAIAGAVVVGGAVGVGIGTALNELFLEDLIQDALTDVLPQPEPPPTEIDRPPVPDPDPDDRDRPRARSYICRATCFFKPKAGSNCRPENCRPINSKRHHCSIQRHAQDLALRDARSRNVPPGCERDNFDERPSGGGCVVACQELPTPGPNCFGLLR